jgi:hypothetical protein
MIQELGHSNATMVNCNLNSKGMNMEVLCRNCEWKDREMGYGMDENWLARTSILVRGLTTETMGRRSTSPLCNWILTTH